LAAVILLLWKWQTNASASNDDFNSSDWKETYEVDSKNPHGLYLFFRFLRIQKVAKKIVVISDRYKLDSILLRKEKVVFCSISDTIGFTENEWLKIKAKIERGSTFFLSSFAQTNTIFSSLGIEEQRSFAFEKRITVKWNENRQKIDLYCVKNLDTIFGEWYGLSHLSASKASELMRFQGLTAMYALTVGKGTFFHHTLPQSLTNVALKNPKSFEYLSFVAQQLPSHSKIYVLKFATIHNTSIKSEFDEEINRQNESLLKFILESRILRNTMMLTFGSIFLFILFRTRRRKHLVPVLPPKTNTTLAFVDSIASIFLKQQIPSSILAMQRKNFFDTVLRYYYIDMHRNVSEENIRLLAEKTGFEIQKLSSLINSLNMRHASADNDFVSNVARIQLEFYTHCGIHQTIEEQFKSTIEIRRNSWLSILVLTMGTLFFLQGLIMLAKSNPVGAVLWSIGWAILFWAFARFLRIHFRIKNGVIEIYSVFGKKLKVKNPSDFKVHMDEKNIILEWDGKKKVISKFDTMRVDRSRLERFIHLKDEHDNR